jgi:NADH:ubiquinone oxidoreductase subunit 6 (subunit J)
MMSVSTLAAAAPQAAISTQGLVNYLQSLFGPLFLGLVGIAALFFLFTPEITRFVQFVVLAVAMTVVFYTPGIAWNSDAAGRAARLRPVGSDAY